VPCSSVNPVSKQNCGIDIYVELKHAREDELV
jgi:hypothetical protein